MALVFQYGSNCLESQISGESRLRGDARFLAIAQTVDEYRLAFDVFSRNRNCAAADIVPSPGSKVWGVVYEVPDFLIERETAACAGGLPWIRSKVEAPITSGALLTCDRPAAGFILPLHTP